MTANEGEIFNQKADQQVFVYLARDAHIHIAGNNSVLHNFCRSDVFKVWLRLRGGAVKRCFSQSDTRVCRHVAQDCHRGNAQDHSQARAAFLRME